MPKLRLSIRFDSTHAHALNSARFRPWASIEHRNVPFGVLYAPHTMRTFTGTVPAKIILSTTRNKCTDMPALAHKCWHTHLQCLNARTHARTRAHTHTHTNTHARAHTHAREHARTCTHTHARAHTRTHAHTHARTHTHERMCTHSHTHARMHSRAHAHTHTHTPHTHTFTRTHARAHRPRHARTHAHKHACTLSSVLVQNFGQGTCCSTGLPVSTCVCRTEPQV